MYLISVPTVTWYGVLRKRLTRRAIGFFTVGGRHDGGAAALARRCANAPCACVDVQPRNGPRADLSWERAGPRPAQPSMRRLGVGHQGLTMKTRTLFAAVLASAFAFPLAANAGNAKDHGGKTATHANDGGAKAMFITMDKDGDGFISKTEAIGSPHDATFAQLDTNGDGKLSSAEHA